MGLFSSLFGKKIEQQNIPPASHTSLQKGDTFIAVADNVGFKVIRNLTTEQNEKINSSTIRLMATQLYMHYWTDGLVCENPNDQTWQNKVLFFWKAEEPFPKKSLPPIFESFKTKNFVFVGSTPGIGLKKGQAMPWFGMPGLGEKHGCEIHGQKISIPELNKLGIVQYVEPVELTDSNLDILTDIEHYLFLIDERITQFRNSNFYLKDTPVPIEVAYSVGGLHIVKKVSLQ